MDTRQNLIGIGLNAGSGYQFNSQNEYQGYGNNSARGFSIDNETGALIGTGTLLGTNFTHKGGGRYVGIDGGVGNICILSNTPFGKHFACQKN